MSARDDHATRIVDWEHVRASRSPDPIAYMRARLLAAEERYASTGHRDDLALLRAYEASVK